MGYGRQCVMVADFLVLYANLLRDLRKSFWIHILRL
ncbi:hypothetical protein SAMN05444166_5677 [Singulisphaera sp. GP187]|nr:hypothetical protein SAMN05444166_5677 [Singulisphaera sp. GP187]